MACRAWAQWNVRATTTDRRRKSQTAPRTGAREAAEPESFAAYSIGKIYQNPRRRAPDVMRAVGEGVKLPPLPLPLHAAALAVNRIKQKRERFFEYFFDFIRIGSHNETFAQQPHHRQDRKAGAGFVP